MSVFLGVVHFDGSQVETDQLRQMMRFAQGRGIETHTIWNNGNVGFGHALLKTTRVSQYEVQPLTLNNITITADARLYGRDSLRAELDSAPLVGDRTDNLPPTTSTTPDPELILRAYLRWGDSFLEHLIGEFAFGIWDANLKRILLARDHMGISGLYYSRVGSTLVFSNYLGVVRQYPGVSSSLNQEAIGGFLLLGHQTWDNKASTIFETIKRIPPAHRLYASADKNEVQRYWTLPLNPPMLRFRSLEEYAERCRELLVTAVKDRLDADRVVIQLSGGLDSSAIAIIAAQLISTGEVSTQLHSITGVYDRIHPDVEAFYVGIIVRGFSLSHEFFPRDHYAIRDPFPVYSEPRQDYTGGAVEDYLRQIASHAPLSLVGQGSDEIFYQSPVFDVLHGLPLREAFDLYRWLWRFTGKRPPFTGLDDYLRRRFLHRDEVQPAYEYPVWFNPEFETQQHLKERWDEFWRYEPPLLHRLEPMAYTAVTTPDWRNDTEFMHPVDFSLPRMSMPFLDVRLVEFALSLPPFPWVSRKYLLRQAMKNDFPPEILYRPKTPLGRVVNSMLRLPGVEWVDQWKPIPELAQYVRRDAIPQIAGNPLKEDPPDQLINLRPLMLNNWLKHFLDKRD